MIELDVVDANIPLLLSRQKMKKLGVTRGPLLMTGNGLPMIELRRGSKAKQGITDQAGEIRDNNGHLRTNEWEPRNTDEATKYQLIKNDEK